MTGTEIVRQMSREQLVDLRQRWRHIALDTRPASRTPAERGIAALYAAVGLRPPREVVWTGSPVANYAVSWHLQDGRAWPLNHRRRAMTKRMTEHIERICAGIGRRTPRLEFRHGWARRASEEYASLFASFPRRQQPVIHQELVRGLGGIPVQDFQTRIERQVYGAVAPTIWRHRLMVWQEAFSFGMLALHELAGRQGPNMRATPVLDALSTIAANAGWLLPHQHACLVAERPEHIRLNAENRLHATDGPAVHYADGWQLFAWNGIIVPAWLILDPGRISAKLIDATTNMDLRRCMIERMTPESYLRTGKVELVSKDETGSLWVKRWTPWQAWAVVEVVNGTREKDGSYKHYFLQVPPHIPSARAAVAWTYGMEEKQYMALGRRT